MTLSWEPLSEKFDFPSVLNRGKWFPMMRVFIACHCALKSILKDPLSCIEQIVILISRCNKKL